MLLTAAKPPPPYLFVPNSRECFDEKDVPGASWSAACFPEEKLEECLDESWTLWSEKYAGYPNGHPKGFPFRCNQWEEAWLSTTPLPARH